MPRCDRSAYLCRRALQLVGPAVALHVLENLRGVRRSLPGSPNLQALVAAGRPGIYDWTPDGEPYQ